jgi:hypothetical protein
VSAGPSPENRDAEEFALAQLVDELAVLDQLDDPFPEQI